MVTAQYLQGRRVLATIESAVTQARGRAGQLQKGLGQLDSAMQELLDRRSDALLDLARHYLPDMNQQSIHGTFDGIRSELQEVLSRKQRRGSELAAEWDRSLDQRQQLETELDSVTERLDELVAQREQLEEAVAQRLQDDTDFQELSYNILSAEEVLQRNEARTAEIKQDAAEKLPAYRCSRLFQYLVERDFGTSKYKAKGWTRRWDRWIANMIDFTRAKRSYDFLRVTPELMTAEVERRQQSLSLLLDRAEAQEQAVADEMGLTEVLREGEVAGKQRDDLITQLEKLAQNAEGIKNELVALEGTQNDFYEEAISKFGHFLQSMEESALEARTRATPERKDDQIFAEIKHFNRRLDAAKQQSAELHGNFREWEPKLRGLEQLVRRFHTAEFDSRRSLFAGGFDLERLLRRFLEGGASEHEVWSTLQQHQQFAPAWHEEAGGRVVDVIDSEFSYVMLRALAEVANQAMRNGAFRNMQNRGPSLPRWKPPGRSAPRRRTSGRSRRRGGFTSGRGF